VSLLYEVECTAACEGVCDDGSMCTMDDVCVDGVCLGTPVDCGDGIDCTVDTCDELVGCVHTPDDAFCASDNPCVVGVCAPDTEGCIDSILEDGTPCGGNSTCIEGQCVCLFPDCEGKVCGDDGCGGSCGECAEGLFCAGGICVETPPGKYMRVTWFLDGQIMPVVHGGISGEILQLHTWWGNHAIKVDLDNDGSIDFDHPDTYPNNPVDAIPYIGLSFSDGFGLLDYNLWTDYWVDDTHGVVKCWSSCSDKAWGAGATFYVDDQGFACDSNEWKYNGEQVVSPPLYCIQWNTCGDGQVAGDETCDDYNRIDGDGCSADCLLE